MKHFGYAKSILGMQESWRFHNMIPRNTTLYTLFVEFIFNTLGPGKWAPTCAVTSWLERQHEIYDRTSTWVTAKPAMGYPHNGCKIPGFPEAGGLGSSKDMPQKIQVRFHNLNAIYSIWFLYIQLSTRTLLAGTQLTQPHECIFNVCVCFVDYLYSWQQWIITVNTNKSQLPRICSGWLLFQR